MPNEKIAARLAELRSYPHRRRNLLAMYLYYQRYGKWPMTTGVNVFRGQVKDDCNGKKAIQR